MKYAMKTKWKWAGHIARTKENRRIIRMTENETEKEAVRRDDGSTLCRSTLDKNSQIHTHMETYNGGLYPAVNGQLKS